MLPTDWFRPRSEAVHVLHPLLRHLGRIWIDELHIEPTRGLTRWRSHGLRPPSLCVLHLQDRCFLKERCNQIHLAFAPRTTMITITNALMPRDSTRTCCRHHGDPASRAQTKKSRGLVTFVDRGGCDCLTLPAHRLAATRYKLDRRSRVPFTAVCRLHLRGECSFGPDCGRPPIRTERNRRRPQPCPRLSRCVARAPELCRPVDDDRLAARPTTGVARPWSAVRGGSTPQTVTTRAPGLMKNTPSMHQTGWLPGLSPHSRGIIRRVVRHDTSSFRFSTSIFCRQSMRSATTCT